MIALDIGQRLILARGEAALVSLPVCDATGESWKVSSCTAALGNLALETSIADGVARAAIPPQTSLGQASLSWAMTGSDTTVREYETRIEVVGAHLCSLRDIRAYNSGANVDGFDSVTRYPDDVLFYARQQATDTFERACCRAFSPRKAKQTVTRMSPVIALEHADVSSVTSNRGYPRLLSDCQIALDGIGIRELPAELTMEYGLEDVPEEVRAAVVKLTATILRPLNRPEGATGESTDYGYIKYTLAGRDGATGIPDVDAVIGRWQRRRLGVM